MTTKEDKKLMGNLADTKSKGDKSDELAMMRFWLESDDPDAIAWRTNYDNTEAIGKMILDYADMPGGKAAFIINQKIAEERKQAEIAERVNQQAEETAERLRVAALADWKRQGGTEADFNQRWDKYRVQLIESGRARILLEMGDEERRRRTARTF